MKIDICLSPALYPHYKQDNDIVIVVDIFRATTTICAMFENGATGVYPIASTEEAKEYKSKGYLVGGERNTKKMDFADFGNSPFDYTRNVVEGKDLVFTTTNGTYAIDMARESKIVFAGAFSNIDTLVKKCANIGGRIVVLCSGWKNKVNIEDTLFAGAFASKLSRITNNLEIESDSVRMSMDLWDKAKSDPLDYIKNSDHYKRLVDNGSENEIPFCLKENTTSVTPRYYKDEKKMRID